MESNVMQCVTFGVYHGLELGPVFSVLFNSDAHKFVKNYILFNDNQHDLLLKFKFYHTHW